MDELRRERKIKMVLNDEEIEEYIALELDDVSLEDKDLDPHVRRVLEEKSRFKSRLCEIISILKLGYMFTVLTRVHPNRASMLGADSYIAKFKKLEKKAKSGNKRDNFQAKKSLM